MAASGIRFFHLDPLFHLRGNVTETIMYQQDSFLSKKVLAEKVEVDQIARTIHRSFQYSGEYQVEHYSKSGLLIKVEHFTQNRNTSTDIYTSFSGIMHPFYHYSEDLLGNREAHTHTYRLGESENTVIESWDRNGDQGFPLDYKFSFNGDGLLIKREIHLADAPPKHEEYNYDSDGNLEEVILYIGGVRNEVEFWEYTFDEAKNWTNAKLLMDHHANGFEDEWNERWFERTGIKQAKSSPNAKSELVYDYSREIVYR